MRATVEFPLHVSDAGSWFDLHAEATGIPALGRDQSREHWSVWRAGMAEQFARSGVSARLLLDVVEEWVRQAQLGRDAWIRTPHRTPSWSVSSTAT